MKQQLILQLVDETTSLRKQWAYQMPVWWNSMANETIILFYKNLMKQQVDENNSFMKQQVNDKTGWWNNNLMKKSIL